jgi:hypothetical protein
MTTFPHVRLVAQGTLGSTGAGNEIWSCGLKVGVAAAGDLSNLLAPTASDIQELGDSGLTAWVGLIHSQSSGSGTFPWFSPFSSDVQLVLVKTSAVTAAGPDDQTIDSYLAFAPDNTRGYGAAGLAPYQTAVVASLHGDTYKRGAAANGRIYLPVPNLGVTNQPAVAIDKLSNGLMALNAIDAFSRVVGQAIDKINATVLSSGHLPMVANISTSAAASGLRWQNVTKVSVDARPDTVRRRANALQGLVDTQTLPVPAA